MAYADVAMDMLWSGLAVQLFLQGLLESTGSGCLAN